MTWKDLAKELERITEAAALLRVEWFAVAGSEDYGIWLFDLNGQGTDKVHAAFSLIAAHVIERLGIRPIPTPEPSQHCPAWRQYCDEREEEGRLQGKAGDFSSAVPLGLGGVDRNAVDPCTRACLELLRRDSATFRFSESGTWIIKGEEYRTISGTIPDVCGALEEYCLRRAREEIETRLTRGSAPPGRILADTIDEQAEHRKAVVMPILNSKRWKRGRWAAAAGVGKNSVYEYLAGKRRLSEENRKAMAEVLDLTPEQLPE